MTGRGSQGSGSEEASQTQKAFDPLVQITIMVYLHYPHSLTEEEELLQRKYAKLKKKKKALAALRAPKQELKEPAKAALKRPVEAADATEQAKKLLKSGVIKVAAEKKDNQTFKRSKRLKEQDKTTVGFQPFSPSHSTEQDDEKSERGAPRRKSLYDSFVSSRDRDGEHKQRFDRDREGFRRDRDPPKKGNTIYVHAYSHGLTEELLRTAFSNMGAIVNINVEREKNCGFVTFEKMECADQAIAEMNGSMIKGIQLKVSMARRQPTYEPASSDPSSASWASLAANQSQKGNHKDNRELVTYDGDDIF